MQSYLSEIVRLTAKKLVTHCSS